MYLFILSLKKIMLDLVSCEVAISSSYANHNRTCASIFDGFRIVSLLALLLGGLSPMVLALHPILSILYVEE